MNKQTRVFKRRLKKRRRKAMKRKIVADKRLSLVRKVNKIKRAYYMEPKKLKLNVDYKVDEKDKKNGETPSPQTMTEDYINYAVNSVFKDGLEGQKRRIWARIKTKISDGVDKDAEDVIIEAAEVDFLKDAFAKSKCPPGIAQYYVILEDEINKL